MRRTFLSSIALGGMLAFSATVHAADIAPPDTSDWTFTVAPYLWASGLNGKAGAFGLPAQDVDASFSDILENLQFAVMAVGEARNGRFSIGMDIAYTVLGNEVNTPNGIVANDIDVSSTLFMGTVVGGYSIFETDTANVDLVAGARLWSADLDLDVNGGRLDGRNFGDGATWVDPLAGAKFKAELTPEIYIAGWGMIGGFGVSSDLMWDVFGGGGYKFNDSFSMFAGYRAVSVDYSDDGFTYDMVQHGPVFGGAFKF
jgi:hypothetical protein